MSLARFFVERSELAGAEQGETLFLRGANFHHAKNVLRLRRGERLVLCAGDGEDYVCALDATQPNALALRFLEKRRNRAEDGPRLYLWQCLPKGSKMDEIIEKSVELGARAICPVESRRSLFRLKAQQKESKRERWQKIAQSAAAQSGRGLIPEVRLPLDFGTACAALAGTLAGGETLALMAWEEERDATLPQLLGAKDAQAWKEIHLIIGPEGGLDAEEAALAKACGICTLSLGSRILRTETAGPALLAMLNALLPERC